MGATSSNFSEISGDAGGSWFLIRTARKWDLRSNPKLSPRWMWSFHKTRLGVCLRRVIDPETAQVSALVRRDTALAPSIFRTVSVIG